jgi:hypothetical protein
MIETRASILVALQKISSSVIYSRAPIDHTRADDPHGAGTVARARALKPEAEAKIDGGAERNAAQ